MQAHTTGMHWVWKEAHICRLAGMQAHTTGMHWVWKEAHRCSALNLHCLHVHPCSQFGPLESTRVFPGKTFAFVNFVVAMDAIQAKATLDAQVIWTIGDQLRDVACMCVPSRLQGSQG